MWGALRGRWQQLRNWLAVRAGLARGRWHRAELDAAVARWGWWTWPWHERRWRYAVYCPPGLADDTPAPLIVVLHGCRQRALAFAQASGWVRAARQGRFRLLCPQQRKEANPHGCWNWFLPAAQGGRGELDITLRALHATAERWPSNHFAAVGLSAGGGLAALLALHHADQFDAVIAVAAPPLIGRGVAQDPLRVMREGLSVPPAWAVLGRRQVAPLLIVHGRDDEVVNPRCAEQLAEQACTVWERQAGVLAGAYAHGGETAAGVAPGPADTHDWQCADGRTAVRLRLMSGVGHVWSGAPGGHDYVVSDGPDITAECLAFLAQVGVIGTEGRASAREVVAAR